MSLADCHAIMSVRTAEQIQTKSSLFFFSVRRAKRARQANDHGRTLPLQNLKKKRHCSHCSLNRLGDHEIDKDNE